MTLAMPNRTEAPGVGQSEPVAAPAGAPLGKLRRGAWAFAQALTSPLLPSDFLDQFSPLASGADLRGRIEAVHPETRDAVTLVIRPGRGWRGHRPGQYVRIGVDVDGVRQWRAYSITSPSTRGERTFTITTKAIPGGKVSNHLVRRARPGLVVQLDQAAGDFHLPDEVPSHLLFVTAGSGITPVMGMLRSGATDGADVVVVHSAPTPAEGIFAGELKAMARAGRIRLVLRHTETDGIITPHELSLLVPDLAARETWACGPTGMLDELADFYGALGIDSRLHTERFRTKLAATGEGGEVTFTRAGVQVSAQGATTLLDAGEQAGVLMPSGCRMGICYGCVVPLREGSVRDLRNGNLTTAAPGDGVKVQTCISAAAGACELEV